MNMSDSEHSNICNNYYDSLDDYCLHPYQPNNNNNVNMLNLNAQSLSSIKKFDKFKELLSKINLNIHIIVVQETWFKEELTQIYQISGYNEIFSCREDGYGGVAIYVRDDIEYEQREIENGIYNSVEIKLLNVFVNSKPATIYGYYRTYQTRYNDFLHKLSDKLERFSNEPAICVGDSNIDLFEDHRLSDSFRSMCYSNGFTVCNTHITRPSSKSMIDHVICNFSESMELTIDTVQIGKEFSDHNLLVISMSIQHSITNYVMSTTTFIDYDAMRCDLADSCGDVNILTETDPNVLCNKLTSLIKTSLAHHTLSKTVRTKKRYLLCPWVNMELAKLISKKKNLLKKLKRSPGNEYIRERLKSISILVSNCFKLRRNNYYLERFSKFSMNPKSTWREINSMLGRNNKTGIPKIKLADNRLLSEPKQIATELNSYFTKVGLDMSRSFLSSVNEDINAMNTLQYSINECIFDSVYEDEVHSIIMSLDQSKSTGYDGIPIKVIKYCMYILTPILTRLANLIFESSIYPDSLKVQKVTPIFKSGDRTLPSNYRPISVLPVINKIIEKLIYGRIYWFLNSNKFFYKHQYGFRCKTSTSTATVELINDISEELERGRVVSGLFLDLKKAFDTVNHDILLLKLNYAGVRGTILRLLISYLSNRKQFVIVGNESSEYENVSIGVPQGSVLGPLFFLIYINDMANLPLEGLLYLFADDSALFYPGLSVAENISQIESDLEKLRTFMFINKLTLNVGKTKLIHFRAPNKKIEIMPLEVAGQTIEPSKSILYLGLTLDERLNWDEHIRYVVKKISPGVGILRKFSSQVPTHILKLIYFSIIHSHINYMMEVWGGKKGTEHKSLQVLQNKSIKAIFKLSRFHDTYDLYKNISPDILPLRSLYFYHISIWMYKNLNGLSYSNISFNQALHSYDTRRRHHINTVSVKTDYCKQRIQYIGPTLFNSLPTEIKDISSLSIFKLKLKNYIIMEKLAELLGRT